MYGVTFPTSGPEVRQSTYCFNCNLQYYSISACPAVLDHSPFSFLLIATLRRDVIKTFTNSRSFFPQGDLDNNDYLFHCRISRVSALWQTVDYSVTRKVLAIATCDDS